MTQQKMKQPEAYATYGEYFKAMQEMISGYDDLPMDSLMSAWSRASLANQPFIQNSRVKHISSFPRDYTKSQIVHLLKSPEDNEQPLREVAHGLEWQAYPFRKIRMTYQGVNTYKYYAYPDDVDGSNKDSAELHREGRLVDRFNHALRPEQWTHQIVGQVIQEGKVAYVPRWSVDKPHNKVNYAFMQQLPSDWYKIVGLNSESKYTVMFNMVYLLAVPGADWRQFGDLLVPYLRDFETILEPYGLTEPEGLGKRFVYAGRDSIKGADGRRWRINQQKFNAIRDRAVGDPRLYNQNGRWAYWVTLPVDKVWVFEADDTTKAVVSPLTGLFLAFDRLSDLEDVQLSILQNPLVQIALGEMETTDPKEMGGAAADPIKLSPAGRATYLAYWYQMLALANAGGIACYFAPVRNLHLESLPEATNATKITTEGYGYAVLKSGLSGLIPINSDPRAGAVNISAKLEENYCWCVYRQMENMMESVYRQLKLRFNWRFKMFGGFVSDKEDLEVAQAGMKAGILPETLKYMALRGWSLWEDISISHLIQGSGIMELRRELATMASPDGDGISDSMGTVRMGRPTKDITTTIEESSEAQESDLDGDDEI